MRKIKILKLENAHGTVVRVMNFGATILGIDLKKEGKRFKVVTGPLDPEVYTRTDYREAGKFFGATVGRFAGRISPGTVSINDTQFQLSERNGVHLHGGENGLSYRFWEIEEVQSGMEPSVLLRVQSPSGEEGYPGNLVVKVRYTLTDKNEVWIEYEAETDQDTLLNLTNHTYFNLNGRGEVSEHRLQIAADRTLEVDSLLVPTGSYLGVKGTSYDFRNLRRIGSTPLDTTFIFKPTDTEEKKITLYGNESGISLEVFSNQPAVVVYVPEDLPGTWEYSTPVGNRRQAICLETQIHPNSPHHRHFPSSVVRAGQRHTHFSKWAFAF